MRIQQQQLLHTNKDLEGKTLILEEKNKEVELAKEADYFSRSRNYR